MMNFNRYTVALTFGSKRFVLNRVAIVALPKRKSIGQGRFPSLPIEPARPSGAPLHKSRRISGQELCVRLKVFRGSNRLAESGRVVEKVRFRFDYEAIRYLIQ
jgi:hypothetical protein